MYAKRIVQALPFLAVFLMIGIIAVSMRLGGYSAEIPVATATFDFTQAPIAPHDGLTFVGWMQPGQICRTDSNNVSNQGEFSTPGTPDLLIDPINQQTSPQLKTMSSTLQVIDGVTFSYTSSMGDNIAVWEQENTAPTCAITTIP